MNDQIKNPTIKEAETELTVITQQVALEPSKVETLLQSYAGSFAEAKVIAAEARQILVTDETQTELMQTAREKRLELRKIRVNVENTRVQLKEQSLREGKAIDGMANIIKALIVPVEEHLEKQEKFAEILAAERAEKINAERVLKLSKYVDDPSIYNVKDMSEPAFNNLLGVCKTAFEAKQKEKEEAERRKLEAEAAERERVAKMEAENAKLREQKRKVDEKLAKERAAKKAAEDKLEAERQAKIKAEREAKEKELAEQRAAEEAKRKALLAPDKEKLIDFATTIDKLNAPNVASKEAGEAVRQAIAKLTEVSGFLRAKAQNL
jgi:colicin import membrane protein